VRYLVSHNVARSSISLQSLINIINSYFRENIHYLKILLNFSILTKRGIGSFVHFVYPVFKFVLHLCEINLTMIAGNLRFVYNLTMMAGNLRFVYNLNMIARKILFV